MTENDFLSIEKALEIRLPESYKAMMREEKLAQTRFKDVVFSDPAKVIAVNQRLRKRGYGGKLIKPTHFVFAYDPDDNRAYFHIDVEVEDGEVFMFDRTKGWAYSQEHPVRRRTSLADFVDYYWRWEERLTRRETTPPVELTEQQKKEKREAFFLELRKQMEEQMKMKE